MNTKITLLLLAFLSVFTVNAQDFQVFDIHPSGNSEPVFFTEYDGKLYFAADDGIHGNELWYTDGSISGNQMLKDINPAGNTSLIEFEVFNGKLYFTANDDISGWELWVTDGTTAGTQLLKDISGEPGGSVPSYLIEFNNQLYFSAYDNINGRELWVTDGTTAGTQMVKNIHLNGSSNPSNFKIFDNKLYFTANDGINGNELWVTNGTTLGTQLLKTINPAGDSNPTGFTAYNGKLYFSANDGSNGRELWVTDGTTSGTYMVKDINPIGNSSAAQFTVYNGKLYFRANNGTNGFELWESDGSAAGTQLFLDITNFIINGEPFSTYPKNFTEYNGKLYFNGGYGRILFVTDGTVAGTQEVKTINTSTGSSTITGSLENFNVYNNRIYFTANDGTNGLELWESDGTPEGTQKIAPDISPNSNPLPEFPFLTVFQNSLYFSANFNGAGLEPWKLTTEVLNIEDVDYDQFSFYPNPVKDVLHLKSAESINQVTIVDMLGKIVYQNSFDSNTVNISIEDLSQALYVVKIKIQNKVKTIKISKS